MLRKYAQASILGSDTSVSVTFVFSVLFNMSFVIITEAPSSPSVSLWNFSSLTPPFAKTPISPSSHPSGFKESKNPIGGVVRSSLDQARRSWAGLDQQGFTR